MKIIDTRNKDFTGKFAPLEDRFLSGDGTIAKRAGKIVRDVRINGGGSSIS